MKIFKKVPEGILFVVALLLCFFQFTVFAGRPAPLAPPALHKKGIDGPQAYEYLKNKLIEIKNIHNENEQTQAVEKLYAMYYNNKIDMPAVEPKFMLKLCRIVRPIRSESVKLLIAGEIFFQLLHRQLIYDKDRANFWITNDSQLFKGGKQTFEDLLYRDYFRVLYTKRGVCRNYVNVMKVIFDELGIINFLIYSHDHIFNGYICKKIRICDLTWGNMGDCLLSPKERFVQLAEKKNSPQIDYLNDYYKMTEYIKAVYIPPEIYNTVSHEQAVYFPTSYFHINYDYYQKRRKLVIVKDGFAQSGEKSSKDILNLFNINLA